MIASSSRTFRSVFGPEIASASSDRTGLERPRSSEPCSGTSNPTRGRFATVPDSQSAGSGRPRITSIPSGRFGNTSRRRWRMRTRAGKYGNRMPEILRAPSSSQEARWRSGSTSFLEANGLGWCLRDSSHLRSISSCWMNRATTSTFRAGSGSSRRWSTTETKRRDEAAPSSSSVTIER